ncbi:MAG: antitoxin Xre/MbcA/ParS toxin-binding domain-containing protein [Balneolaceae bacterium]
MSHSEIREALVTYGPISNKNTYELINYTKSGINYTTFAAVVKNSPFDIKEWAAFLHTSERTIQRYQKDKKAFGPVHSEKIIQIVMLLSKGIEVFGNKSSFYTWLETKNIALGGIKPKDLLDSSFGIDLLNNELIRIEHGILA